jgi:hypothetical protein
MDTNHDTPDHHGNGNRRRTLKMDTGEQGGRSLTSDFGLDADGYPVMPPAPHYDRGGEA